MKNKILVTGGAGYIGSHTIVDLLDNNFDVISVDNFSRSYESSLEGIKKISGVPVKNYNLDICNLSDLETVFQENDDIAGVIHFAAFKSVPESIEHPLRYYQNNMNSLFNVLACCEKFDVENIVFSSSCSVYGNPDTLPVTEKTPLKAAECAYAATKQMGEEVVKDVAERTKLSSIALRYFNPVGAHTTALLGEQSVDRPNNLLPIVTQTAAGLIEKMSVWGSDYDTRDGSCIRDYIHVMDIANAHTKALQYLLSPTNKPSYQVLNLGSGNGVSVLEIIEAFEKVSGEKLNYELGPRREGDVIAVYADNSEAQSVLDWEVTYDTEDMLKTAWDWQKQLLKS